MATMVGAAQLTEAAVTGIPELNTCILRHMLIAYGEPDDLNAVNMANLFDAVTSGYHKNAAPHNMTQIVSIAVPCTFLSR